MNNEIFSNLKHYQSIKEVDSKPCTDHEYNQLLVEVSGTMTLAEMGRKFQHGRPLTDTDSPKDGYLVVYNLGKENQFVSWSPKKEFEEGYIPCPQNPGNLHVDPNRPTHPWDEVLASTPHPQVDQLFLSRVTTMQDNIITTMKYQHPHHGLLYFYPCTAGNFAVMAAKHIHPGAINYLAEPKMPFQQGVAIISPERNTVSWGTPAETWLYENQCTLVSERALIDLLTLQPVEGVRNDEDRKFNQ